MSGVHAGLDRVRQVTAVPAVRVALIVFGFALAGVIVGLVGYGLWIAHDRALAASAQETARLARVFEQHAAQTAVVVDRTLMSARKMMNLQGAAAPFDPSLTAELQQLLAGAPQMIALSVLDRSGRVVQDSRGAALASAPF